MKKIDRLTVSFNGREVGLLSVDADGRLCVFVSNIVRIL